MSRSLLSLEADIGADRAAGNLLGETALSLYGVAGHVANPFAGALLSWRATRGREDSARRGERFGVARRTRPTGRLVWVHAASVGETLAVLPLVQRLTERGPTILLTTGTVTAAKVAATQIPSQAIHQFVPIDTPVAVGRFLDHWRPDLALFAESELWPTTLRALDHRAVPLVIVNARMSHRSFRRWRAFPSLARAILRRADLFLAQASIDAERLSSLGAGRVLVSGNMKFDVPPPSADEAVVNRMRAAIGDRPVLIAASTHEREETAVISAHAEAAGRGIRLLTIIAPRHPGRGSAVADEIAAAGFSCRRRSLQQPIDSTTDIFVADTIGEMGLWYRLADVAFLGGSLVPRGGQNPIEPAKLMVPILHGTLVGNFSDVYQALGAAGATRPVPDVAALTKAVGELIDNAGERERMAARAYQYVERTIGALDRTLEALEPYIAALDMPHEAAART
jgi:3-deoxy-D-manno-octulosonic-acid transferase